MKLIKKRFSTLIVLLAGACLSLGWHHHIIKPLPAAALTWLIPMHPSDKMVDIQIKTLTSTESRELLGHDLPSKGVQPLHLTIQNNTPESYSFNPEAIDLSSINPRDVAKKIRKGAIPRMVGFKILGMLFWPFMIPGTIDSIHTMHTYKVLKKDYQAKAVKDEVIPVYSTFNRILFVPKDEFKKEFTITLIDLHKLEPLVFTINMVEAHLLDEAT
jgi:hypothetical protein